MTDCVRNRVSVGAIVFVIAAVAATYLAALPSLFDRFLGLGDAVRIAISLLLIHLKKRSLRRSA